MPHTYAIEAILFPRANESAPKVVTSFPLRLDESQLPGVMRSLFQVSRFPSYEGPYIHGMRARDEHGTVVFRCDDL